MSQDLMKYEYHRKCHRNTCERKPHSECNREKLGVIVAIAEGTKVKFGWSLCHIQLDRFDRDEALKLAFTRLNDDLYEMASEIPSSMRKHFEVFTKDCAKYYKQCYRPILRIGTDKKGKVTTIGVKWKRPDDFPETGSRA